MADRINKPKSSRNVQDPGYVPSHAKGADLSETRRELDEEIDELIDEIDDVLEKNAEEFVKKYVQRGGE